MRYCTPWKSRTRGSSNYHKVRAYISELLAFASKIMVRKLMHARTRCSCNDSANRKFRSPPLRSLCESAGRCRSTLIYWVCEESTTGRGYKNYYSDSRSGVLSGYQGLVPFNPHMTSGFRPYLLLAFLDSVNRVGTTICRWLFQTVHDTDAISAFDYILPLMVRRKPIYAGFKPLFLCYSLSYFVSPKVFRTCLVWHGLISLPQ